MRVLITGDRGFLGRHFRAELTARGCEVHGIDVTSDLSHDCRSYFREAVRRGMEPDAWDLVIHCAAVVGGREKIEGDALATAESLSIDAEMFRWAAIARPGRVLYISSSAAYPVALQRGGPTDGRDPVRLIEEDVELSSNLWLPDEVYGWSKITGELLADRLRRTGVPVTVVRPFSGYGTDQDPAYPFRAITDRAKRREDPLTVWCGPCTRDWIHVDDVIKGALAVAEHHDTHGVDFPVNLCTGRAVNFWDLAAMSAEAVGYEPELNQVIDKPRGVMYRVGDPSRMLEIYQPQITLEQGIERAVRGQA